VIFESKGFRRGKKYPQQRENEGQDAIENHEANEESVGRQSMNLKVQKRVQGNTHIPVTIENKEKSK